MRCMPTDLRIKASVLASKPCASIYPSTIRHLLFCTQMPKNMCNWHLFWTTSRFEMWPYCFEMDHSHLRIGPKVMRKNCLTWIWRKRSWMLKKKKIVNTKQHNIKLKQLIQEEKRINLGCYNNISDYMLNQSASTCSSHYSTCIVSCFQLTNPSVDPSALPPLTLCYQEKETSEHLSYVLNECNYHWLLTQGLLTDVISIIILSSSFSCLF